MRKDFWEDKRMAVTGASGFIGSWLTERLAESGASVTILLRRDSPRGIDGLKNAMGKLKIVYGDVRDYDAVKNLIEDKDFVFHLAAITQVIYAKNHPVETFDTDAKGTLNILEALRKSGGNPFLVLASTDKVYGEPKYLPIDEDHPLSGKSPYDAAKLAADRLAYAYHLTYGLKCSIVRWSNTIGGRDSNILRAVPDFITSIMGNKPPTIRGNGKHIRDYMYVTDAVNGMLLAAQKQNVSKGEVFNIGTERPTSVIELAKLTIKLMEKGDNIKPVVLNQSTVGEIDRQYLSSKKARKKLGWRPQYTLERGLLETIRWYRANPWWQTVIKRVNDYYKL